MRKEKAQTSKLESPAEPGKRKVRRTEVKLRVIKERPINLLDGCNPVQSQFYACYKKIIRLILTV
jgi:hypothetical protein